MIKSLTSTDKLVFLIIGLFTVLAVIFIFVIAIKEQKTAKDIITYAEIDQNRPRVQLSTTSADLGNMNVKDEKTTAFSFKNSGTKPLQLYNINSSCNCTSGKLTIDGKDSPEFSMHSKSSWVGTVGPNKEVILTIIYRPYLMPVKGIVTREVYVQTNDPEQERLTFSVKAFVK